jgi:hypothetical protein
MIPVYQPLIGETERQYEQMLGGACDRFPQEVAVERSLNRTREFGGRFHEICSEAAQMNS